MEFRPVMHSVCRSAAAAAARPSLLAATRPSPAALLLQYHQFSTSSQKPSEATAAAAGQQHRPSPPPQPAQSRVEKLRASLPPAQAKLPPRPPPIRGNYFTDPNAQGKPNQRPSTATQSSGPRGATPSAPSSGSSSLFDDPNLLPSMMHGDMQNATSSMGLWVQDDFASKHYQPEPELRLRPSTGRTVHVKGQVDVARAFRLLDKTVAQNAIKREARMQKSHERPALKRKRQKRERWQVRFKTGMRATIGRVMELKAQGW